MNNSLNEYLRFNFELNIELNHFLARFNVKMNNQNVPPTPTPPREETKNEYDIIRNKLQEMFQEIKVSMSDLSVAKSSAQDKLNVRKLTESTFPS